MTTATVKFLGYDRDGDRVYINEATGRVAQADTVRQALGYFSVSSGGGVDPADYGRLWGPITTKRKR